MIRPQRAIQRATTLAVALLCVTFALAAAGCTPPNATLGDDSEPASAVAVTRMEPEVARAQIDSTFPAEVPVAQGEVVQGKAQGPDAWDYELRVAAPADAVAAWYAAEYLRRSWQLVDQQAVDGVTRLTLRKGSAESLVSIEKSPVDDATIVRVILGVGAPVLETQ